MGRSSVWACTTAEQDIPQPEDFPPSGEEGYARRGWVGGWVGGEWLGGRWVVWWAVGGWVGGRVVGGLGGR